MESQANNNDPILEEKDLEHDEGQEETRVQINQPIASELDPAAPKKRDYKSPLIAALFGSIGPFISMLNSV